jgi:hypothetical protein
VLYRAARDSKGAKYFSREAGARSAIGHWLVQIIAFSFFLFDFSIF